METPNYMESQREKILKFMLNGGKITAIDALKKFGCFRLASRIGELKNLNRYKIVREMIVTKSKKRIARYAINL